MIMVCGVQSCELKLTAPQHVNQIRKYDGVDCIMIEITYQRFLPLSDFLKKL
jgi:hypothetical protein